METTKTAGGSETLAGLIKQVHEAATDAAVLDYPRMAQLLDECGYALASHAANKRRVVEERAHKALAVWLALRTF